MKIKYKNNDATQVPLSIVGTCIQIRQWLRGEQYTPFIKDVLAFNDSKEDECLTLEKRMADADDEKRDALEEYNREE